MNVKSTMTLVAAFVLVAQGSALACACCASDGDHAIQMVKPADLEQAVMRRLRFGPTADLRGGERDLVDFVGLKTPASSYPLSGGLDGNAWRLVFKSSGHDGVLRLLVPPKVLNYSVDIHDGKVAGAGGPLLYKEWRFEGSVQGAGPFKPGKFAPTKYFLVLQGRGNRCDNAEDFTHWHLRLTAGGENYAFTGKVHT